MQRISKKTADLIRSLSFNEWSDEARAAALEARRNKTTTKQRIVAGIGGGLLGTASAAALTGALLLSSRSGRADLRGMAGLAKAFSRGAKSGTSRRASALRSLISKTLSKDSKMKAANALRKKVGRPLKGELLPAQLRLNELLQVINGGPGSGFHGHKGIPGQRGGSLPEGSVGGAAPSNGRISGGSAGLARLLFGGRMPSEEPKAVERRNKNVFTKTSKLADIFGSHAATLESKRKKKLGFLSKSELEMLRDLHYDAWKNFRASAEQSTMVKGSNLEDQLQRLQKADHHRKLFEKYHARLNKKDGVLKGIGSSFVEGAVGSTVKDLPKRLGGYVGSTAGDIAAEGIRGGFKKALELKGQKVSDLKRVPGSSKLAYPPVEGSPLVRVETPSRYEASRRDANLGEKAAVVRRAVEKSMASRASKHKEAFLNYGKAQDQAARIADAIDYAEYLRKAEADIKKQRRQLGDTTSEAISKKLQDKIDTLVTRDKTLRGLLKEKGGVEIDELPPNFLKDLTNAEYQDPTFNFAALIANLSGKVRRETLHDREYLVAPLTMIVPGVLAGSKGPLLYPEDEVSKNPTAWNGMPIVVNHPMINGIPVEARSPGILNKYQIGTVFNAKYNGKLVAEGWFDIGRTRKTNIGIYEQLVNNKPIELSTGLYTDNEAFKGTWNGRKYEYVARNYRPDHLAILLGSRGACSIKDGCGVLINKQPTANIVKKTKGGYKLVSHKGKNLGTAKSKAGILKRERQVEYFKHVNNANLLKAGKFAKGLSKKVAVAARKGEHRIIPEISKLVGMRSGSKSLGKEVSAKASKVASKSGVPVKATALGPTPPKVGSAARPFQAQAVRGPDFKPSPKAKKSSVVKDAVDLVKKHPTATALAGVGAAGYVAGRRKKRTDNIRTEVSSLVQVINFGYQVASKAFGKPQAGESKVKKFARMGHHATGGFGSAVAGGVGGAALGAALTGPAAPVGAIIGGAAGSAAGAWAARRQSQKFGKAAGTASDIGGLAGAIATPGGAAKVAGRAAPKLGMAARFKSLGTKAGAIGAGKSLAKGTGRLAADTATFTGTTAGLDKAFGPKKRRPVPIRNAWTEAARRKSIETRKRNAHVQTRDQINSSYRPAVAIAIGTAAGVGSRLGTEVSKTIQGKAVDKAKSMGRTVLESFKDIKDVPISKVRTGPEQFQKYIKPKKIKVKPGLGRRVISLLKKIRIRRI